MEKLYNLKIIKSGNRIEIYKYHGYMKEGTEGKNKEGRKGKGEVTKDKKEINRRETLYKARNNIVRIISCNEDMQTFITLTYADNMQDLKQSKKHINYFFKKLTKDYPKLKYIYVLEFQERGAIHYHILCSIKLNIKTSESKKYKPKAQKELENYFRVNYWSNRGFVDIRNLESEGITNVAKYVSAYLVEDLLKLDLEGHRAYGYSLNINRPIIEKVDIKAGNADILEQYKDEYKMTYSSQYQVHYIDKNGQERESNVYYYDLMKEE